MSDLFDNIKPGHTVHYLTPQGQTRKGRVVMNKGTHLVLNAGGRYGTPQVVTQRNFVKAQDGTRVTSALLSNVAKSLKKEEVVNELDNKTLLSYAYKAMKQGGNNRYLDVLSLNPKDKARAEKRTKGLAAMSRALGRNFKAGKAPVEEAKLSPAEAKRKAIKRAARNYADARRTAAVNRQSPYKLGEPQMNAAKAFGWVKEEVRSPTDAEYSVAKKFMNSKKNASDLQLGGLGVHKKTGNINVHIITKDGKGMGSHHVLSPEGKELREDSKLFGVVPFKKGDKSVADKVDHAYRKTFHKKRAYDAIIRKLDRASAKTAERRAKAVDEATWQGAEDPYNWDPVMRAQVFKAAAEKNRAKQVAKGQPVPHKLDTGRALKSSPAPFRRGMKEERIEEAKKAVKAVDWGKVETLNYSVLKSGEGGIPLKHHMAALAAAGVPSRKWHSPYVGHTALQVPKKHARKASKILYGYAMNEEQINELDSSTLASYVSKAIADRKKSQSGADMARRIHTPERAAYFVDKMGKRAAKRSAGIKKAVGKIASNLPSEPLKAHADSEGSKHGGWSGMEARESEWTANQQLAGQSRKKQAGHYLVRDGRTLSGPHKPHEAVAAYKGMSDNKGVKIVHVKETHMFDVTNELLSEAKVKDAAKLAISLKKKAKGNAHVNTEPALKIPDRSNTGTIEGNPEEQENAKV